MIADIRYEASRILQQINPPKYNLFKSEIKAFKTLERANDIILPTDKGSVIVIMNNNDYKKNILELLDPAKYKLTPKDPICESLIGLSC